MPAFVGLHYSCIVLWLCVSASWEISYSTGVPSRLRVQEFTA